MPGEKELAVIYDEYPGDEQGSQENKGGMGLP
jgi:hypothetical protein